MLPIAIFLAASVFSPNLNISDGFRSEDAPHRSNCADELEV